MARKFNRTNSKSRKKKGGRKSGRPPRDQKASEGYVLMEGEVIEAHPNTQFDVEVTMSGPDGAGEKKHKVLCYVGGAMRNIFVTVGDLVRVEVSIYDLSKGRIVWRLNKKNPEQGRSSRRSRRGD